MSDNIKWDKVIEAIHGYCVYRDMHEVCYFCDNKCKQPYTRWSGLMPPTEYCDLYEED